MYALKSTMSSETSAPNLDLAGIEGNLGQLAKGSTSDGQNQAVNAAS
jgi:hypothetical protein